MIMKVSRPVSHSYFPYFQIHYICLCLYFFLLLTYENFCCSVTQSCPILCDPMDCSTQSMSLLVPHYLLKFPQVHVHCIGDAIQPSHPLTPSSPSTLFLKGQKDMRVITPLFLFSVTIFCSFTILIHLQTFYHYLTIHLQISIHSLFFCSYAEDLGFASIVDLTPPFFTFPFLKEILCSTTVLCTHLCVFLQIIRLCSIMRHNKIRRGRHNGITR